MSILLAADSLSSPRRVQPRHLVGGLLLGSTVALVSLVLAGSALAHPPSTVTITSTIDVPSLPSPAPFKQTYPGTFTTSAGDSGTETVEALFAAVPSPTVGVFQSVQTLTSNDGTLVLRCHQLATPEDYLTYPSVPSSGSCAVISGAGAYAGFTGSAALNGVGLFNSAGTGGAFTETVSLGG